MKRNKKKVLVAINTLTSIGAGPYADHTRLFYRLGRDHRQFDFFQMVGRRMSIDRFRNMAAITALEGNMDYIFFIDDDMHLPPDTFIKLYQAKLDIIMAHVYIRGYPYDIMAFKGAKDGTKRMVPLEKEDIVNGGVVRCSAIGTAVSLINVRTTIKKIPSPWFVTGQHNTEDIYFCCKCRDYNKKTTIGMHTGVITGHVLDPEVISYGTKDSLVQYHESYLDEKGKLLLHEANGDRGLGYVKENIEPLVNHD